MAVSRRVELIGAVRAVKRVRVRAVAAMTDERQQQLMGAGRIQRCVDGERKMWPSIRRDVVKKRRYTQCQWCSCNTVGGCKI